MISHHQKKQDRIERVFSKSKDKLSRYQSLLDLLKDGFIMSDSEVIISALENEDILDIVKEHLERSEAFTYKERKKDFISNFVYFDHKCLERVLASPVRSDLILLFRDIFYDVDLYQRQVFGISDFLDCLFKEEPSLFRDIVYHEGFLFHLCFLEFTGIRKKESILCHLAKIWTFEMQSENIADDLFFEQVDTLVVNFGGREVSKLINYLNINKEFIQYIKIKYKKKIELKSLWEDLVKNASTFGYLYRSIVNKRPVAINMGFNESEVSPKLGFVHDESLRNFDCIIKGVLKETRSQVYETACRNIILNKEEIEIQEKALRALESFFDVIEEKENTPMYYEFMRYNVKIAKRLVEERREEHLLKITELNQSHLDFLKSLDVRKDHP